MSNYFIISLFAIIPAILIVFLAKKYNWDDKIPYNMTIVIIGIIGWFVFTYAMILHFNIVLLMINFLLLLGIIQKVVKIIKLKNKKD